ncbi:hypothetical protein CIRMBP1316_00657 [Enterococcus cecorum]|nr:hypothetical protein CIRMBP1316_00657 [Enterococcus cecorum]
MIWHIQVVDSENNIRQQVDFEGSEEISYQVCSIPKKLPLQALRTVRFS